MPLTFQQFEYQGELPEALTEGEVASVRMIEDDVVADVPLFIRSHLIDKEFEIQRFLSSQSTRELYASGPPGCGKTVYMTLVAHRYAKKENKRVLMAGTLLTLQFTVSADHSIKLQFIKDLKEAVESHLLASVSACVHVGVVGDPNNTANFTFKNPEGCGRGSWTLAFTVTASKSSALFASPEKAENYSATTLQTYQVFTKKR